MAASLQLQLGQKELTPAQEAEARRFADERVETQLSVEPVDEPEAEQFLRHAYIAAQLPPPIRLHWLDGPLQLVALAPQHDEGSVRERVMERVREQVAESQSERSLWECLKKRVYASVWRRVEERVSENVFSSVWRSVYASSVGERAWKSVEISPRDSVYASVWESVRAYHAADWLAFYRFFDAYLAPNDLHALAHFNERVSGYWLGSEDAILVRRPRLLTRDAQGRLHNATGTCIEYHDGWGFYAWHGVRVSEQVILSPETLTREEYLREPNVEARRVIQERMGERFVHALGGQVIDVGARGTLYEVQLPRDPEGIARYVQVQDASTQRQYLLQVPTTIQTAGEAVAWTFQVGVQDYRPAQET